MLTSEANQEDTKAVASEPVDPQGKFVRIFNKNKSRFGSYTHEVWRIEGGEFKDVPADLAEKWTKMFPENIVYANSMEHMKGVDNAIEEATKKAETLSQENQELNDRIKNLEAMMKSLEEGHKPRKSKNS